MANDLEAWSRAQERKRIDEMCEIILAHQFSEPPPVKNERPIPIEAWLIVALVTFSWIGFFIALWQIGFL